MAPENRAAALEAVRCEVAACIRCKVLADSRTQTVFGVGNPNAKICFFGEAPGADEDRLGEPFVGRGGQLLNKMLAACGLKREDVYIMNVLKCRPPENRNPLPDEVANCRGYFERQLEIIHPEIICCLGSVASKTLLNTETGHREVARKDARLPRHSGRVHVSSGVFVAQSTGEGGCLGRFEAADAATRSGAVSDTVKQTAEEQNVAVSASVFPPAAAIRSFPSIVSF